MKEEPRVQGDVVATIGFMREWIKEHERECEECQYLEECTTRIAAERRLMQLERAQESEYARKLMEEAEQTGIVVSTRREAEMGDEGVTIKETVEVRMKKETPREILVEGFDREMARIQAGEPKVPLAITEMVEIHIQLSTGGPGDGFKLWRDTDGTYVAGEYYYTDWGVREDLTLNYEEIDWIVGAYGIEGRGATAEEPWYEGM